MTKKNIWVFLAHCDNEFFIYSYIARMAKEGQLIHCVFTTNGVNSGADPAGRIEESRKALAAAGVPAEALWDLGLRLDIPDRSSFCHLRRLYDACLPMVTERGIDEIVLPAWEGGHVDHDTAHLLGQAVARRFPKASVFEFSLYNRFRAPRGLFRVMNPIPNNGQPVRRTKLSFREGWRSFLALRHYPSQWKYFIGLGPEAFLKLAVLRREILTVCPPGAHDYRTRPHPGPLFYERANELKFRDFAAATESFITEQMGTLGPGSNRL